METWAFNDLNVSRSALLCFCFRTCWSVGCDPSAVHLCLASSNQAVVYLRTWHLLLFGWIIDSDRCFCRSAIAFSFVSILWTKLFLDESYLPPFGLSSFRFVDFRLSNFPAGCMQSLFLIVFAPCHQRFLFVLYRSLAFFVNISSSIYRNLPFWVAPFNRFVFRPCQNADLWVSDIHEIKTNHKLLITALFIKMCLSESFCILDV